MSIILLPKMHDDELFGGYLIRLFQETSYIYPKHFTEEIFANKKERINYLRINHLKEGFLNLLDKHFGYENLVIRHTLIGFETLFGNFIGKSWSTDFLRICPICFKDSEHLQLLPQIRELDYCPIHGVRFVNTNISLDRNKSYLIKSGIEVENDFSSEKVELDNISVCLSKYINELLNEPRTTQNNAKISTFLRQHIPKGYFKSLSLTQVNLSAIEKEINNYYKNTNYRLSKRSLARILNGESYNPFEIILIAYWLNISAKDLARRNLKKCRTLDSRIAFLKNKGLSERQIATRLKISKTNVHKRLNRRKEI